MAPDGFQISSSTAWALPDGLARSQYTRGFGLMYSTSLDIV
jgi:hypothetical protein